MQMQEERPPYVQFELRAVEDRAASQQAGHYVPKDVEFAIITPSGSRDKIERIATEWLAHIREQARQGRVPPQWLKTYEFMYQEWKEGREAPLDGTPLNNWPVLTPAQLQLLIGLRIKTVEDLAACTEEAISHMGIGGRSLKEKARDYLAAASNIGKVAEEITSLKAENTALKERNSSLEDRMKELETKIQALTKPEADQKKGA